MWVTKSYLSHFYILRSSFAIIMILTNLKFDSSYLSNIRKIIKIKKIIKHLHRAINCCSSGDEC